MSLSFQKKEKADAEMNAAADDVMARVERLHPILSHGR